MRWYHLGVSFVLFLFLPASLSTQCPAAEGGHGIRVEDFKVTRPSPTVYVIDMKIAKSDLFRSFGVRFVRPVGERKLPSEFFVASNGYAYLKVAGSTKNQTCLLDNGRSDENPADNELRLTIDTKDWPDGGYLLSVSAHNRPGPGSYVRDSRVVHITVGDAPEFENGGSNIPGAVHRVVYQRDGVYACFPSLSVAPDGTLSTGFGTRTRRSHIDPSGGGKRLVSTDGGITWKPATERFIDRQFLNKKGERVRGYPRGWVYVDAEKRDELLKRGKTVRDVRPGKIAYLGGALSAKWDEKDKKWKTAELDVPEYLSGLMCYHYAASAVNTKDGVRLVAAYGRRIDPDQPGPVDPESPTEVVLIRSDDDGETWEVRPMWEAGLPDPKLGFNETALEEAADGTIIAMMRTAPEGNLYQADSRDGGKTWSPPRKTPIHGFPADLLKLRDGRLLCVYGYRFGAMGSRACLSNDNGKTWDISNEFILRSDGAASPGDLGYPSSDWRHSRRLVSCKTSSASLGLPVSVIRYA